MTLLKKVPIQVPFFILAVVKLLRLSFRLDLRALALMRICIASVVLLNLLILSTDLTVFFTDEGVLPVDALRTTFSGQYPWSLNALSGSHIWQVFLFICAALTALAVLVGYQTSISTTILWVLLMSIQNRNPLILQGGDDLLRMTLFWGIFLPWNKRLSVDAAIRPDQSSENSVFSLAGVGLMLQIVYVYLASALEKGPEWYSEFSAIYYVYQLEQIAYAPARWLSEFPLLLKILTAGAYFLELLVGLLLLWPTEKGKLRLTGILLIIAFHLWNGITIQVGLFFIIGIASCLGLLPEISMNFLTTRFTTFVSKLRHFIGRIPFGQPASIQLPEAVKQYILVAAIIYTGALNLTNLPFIPFRFEGWLQQAGSYVRFNQNWGMFAPGVLKDDGWYVYQGYTLEGDTLDLNTGLTYTLTKPKSVVSTFKNDRWRKFGEQYMLAVHQGIREHLCRYQLNKWNQEHPEKKIRQLNIIYMMELTLPDYKTEKAKPCVLCTCY